MGTGRASATGTWEGNGPDLQWSTLEQDPAWDRFLEQAIGGHYTQTAAWARYRSAFGWRSARISASHGRRVVAGAQLLVRDVGPLGTVAYVDGGPVFTADGDDALPSVMHGLERLCRQQRVRYLVVRPSVSDRRLEGRLEDWGLRPSERLAARAAPATARVRLDRPPEAILAGMRRSTRGNIRRGLSRGLTARPASGAELPALVHLYRRAAERRGEGRPTGTRYERLWQAMAADGHAHLFLVEHAGEPVSAQLAIRFGETLYSHLMVWSGEHARHKPNELLEWTAMTWARERGCRYYDFEGVDVAPGTDGADRQRPSGDDSWGTDYKLGFGAEVVALAPYRERFSNPVLRWGYDQVVRRTGWASSDVRTLRRVLPGRVR
ncbi:lipid II:glycine glycyltransferase FemX [Egicoccus sp. AB-alg2]|uniref:lipid II:glycine glycyltransferase FemX n=1 Tax=Egicoccus sp. AB-alg2 TaxID=3242693 RepID=UPI00359EC933